MPQNRSASVLSCCETVVLWNWLTHMDTHAIGYFLFGLTLVVLFAVIIFYYYSKKRHKKVEEPKYKMFDEED